MDAKAFRRTLVVHRGSSTEFPKHRLIIGENYARTKLSPDTVFSIPLPARIPKNNWLNNCAIDNIK